MEDDAFWDLFDNDPPNMEHIENLLDKIKQILYSFVPHRVDIHHRINDNLSGPIEWDFQHKLVGWVEKFQAPIYDQMTSSWKRRLPEKLSKFLKEYYEHLRQVQKGIQKYHKKPSGTNGVPDILNTG